MASAKDHIVVYFFADSTPYLRISSGSLCSCAGASVSDSDGGGTQTRTFPSRMRFLSKFVMLSGQVIHKGEYELLNFRSNGRLAQLH